jgi:hypothetical protein
MTYTKLANGQGRWIVAGVPGHGGENGQVLDTSILNQLRLPRQFHEAVNATLVPGATVLVTQAPVLPENTGAKMTIMASK